MNYMRKIYKIIIIILYFLCKMALSKKLHVNSGVGNVRRRTYRKPIFRKERIIHEIDISKGGRHINGR